MARGLDIVVNNAGVLVGGPFEQFTEPRFDRMMSVNVKGVVLVTQALSPSSGRAAGAHRQHRVDLAEDWPRLHAGLRRSKFAAG